QIARPPVKPVDPPAQQQLGRVPFENGSLGLSTDKSYRTTVFSDGRVTPGFENVQTKDPAYVGFSLSVPTEKNSIFPFPLLKPQECPPGPASAVSLRRIGHGCSFRSICRPAMSVRSAERLAPAACHAADDTNALHRRLGRAGCKAGIKERDAWPSPP